MDNYIQLTISGLTSGEQEILIAQLSDIGFEGFEQGKDFLNAFIPEGLYENIDLNEITGISKHNLNIQKIQQRNWNEEWERSFEPVLVDDFCAIRASFHPSVGGMEHEIVITPKMSFGTGHHATTFQVIQLMREVDFSNKRVLDFGTGTGVLAILAEKSGAAQVHAIDIDEWSIENATENIIANKCSKILVHRADHILGDDSFDIVLANINRHVILEHLQAIAKHLAPKGVVILSGLLKTDEAMVTDAAFRQHLFVKAQSQKYDWIALKLTNVKPE